MILLTVIAGAALVSLAIMAEVLLDYFAEAIDAADR